ncbi:MAG: hypothetical protein JF586_00515 [Burkholderiales bacterium]|nr:hypothetical protein [Burkholderiales bacterium]
MTPASLLRGRWLPFVLASLLAFITLEAAAQLPTKPGKYGRTLIADVVLPPSQLDKMAAFLDTLRASNHGAQNSVAFGETVDWNGDSLTGTPAASPYTIVVQADVMASQAGNVVTTWKTGWRMDNGESRQTLLTGLVETDAKPGQRLTLTGVSSASRFDRDKNVTPVVSFVDARNATVQRVQVQVWSGMPSASFLDYFGAFRFLLLGVVMLVVVLVFRRL